LLSRAAHVELDLCDTTAERQEAGRKFVSNLDRWKQWVDKQPGHSQADLVTVK